MLQINFIFWFLDAGKQSSSTETTKPTKPEEVDGSRSTSTAAPTPTKPEKDAGSQSTDGAAHQPVKPEEEEQTTKTAAMGIATNIIVDLFAIILTTIPLLFNA